MLSSLSGARLLRRGPAVLQSCASYARSAVPTLAVLAGLLLSGAAQAQDGTVNFSGAQPDAPPERYVIQPGDTLWDIATAFMGSSAYWPKLWSFNDYITNPHWIYPGNVVVFRPGTLLEPPTVELDAEESDGYVTRSLEFESVAPACGPDVRFQGDIRSTTYQTPGFIAQPEDVEVWGEVFAAKRGAFMLGEGDMIYLDVEDPDALDCGDVVMVYREGRKVRHPDARNLRYGRMHHVVAEARIVHREGDTLTAIIRESYGATKRGDKVGPAFPVHAEMQVSEPRGDLDGTVIARLGDETYSLAATDETIFVDRGRSDGLRVGNSFYVVHRNDPMQGLDTEDDRIPAQVVGRVVVTHVEENVATAVVVDAADSIRVGDELTMKVE